MNNEKENAQHTINATEGERQLSSVGNNFKETDEVAKDVMYLENALPPTISRKECMDRINKLIGD